MEIPKFVIKFLNFSLKSLIYLEIQIISLLTMTSMYWQ